MSIPYSYSMSLSIHLNALASHTMNLVFTHGIYNTLLIIHSMPGNMCIIHAIDIIGEWNV